MRREPIQRFSERALHKNGVGEPVVGARQNRNTRLVQAAIELVSFLHGHDCIKVAVQNQYGTENLSRGRRDVDFLQVREQ